MKPTFFVKEETYNDISLALIEGIDINIEDILKLLSEYQAKALIKGMDIKDILKISNKGQIKSYEIGANIDDELNEVQTRGVKDLDFFIDSTKPTEFSLKVSYINQISDYSDYIYSKDEVSLCGLMTDSDL